AHSANVENCMFVRWWRVIRLPDGVGEALAALPQPERSARLAGMVGATTLQGEVVRSFGNEAIVHDTTIYGFAGKIDQRSLSLTSLAAPPAPEPAPKAEPKTPAERPPPPPRQPRTA